MKLSIVIPVYNSEVTIEPLVNSLLYVLEQYDLEIILVNDASKDRSEAICENIARSNSRVKFISLRRNSGEHNAVICGLNYCTGKYVAIIDDDFQNPPSEIIALLNKAKKYNYDVVYANYKNKQHSFFRNLCSSINNICATHLINKPPGLYLSSFKVISKEIIDDIISYKGPFPYIDALILRCTSNIGSQTVMHHNRIHGKSNYTLKKLLSLYLNIVINFSYRPLRIVTIFGLIISLFSFIMSLNVLYEKFFLRNLTPGWTFISILLLFSIGATFVVIGLMGEYLGKILMAVNNSPQYTIKKKMNIDIENMNSEKINTNLYDRKTI
ncbi:MAG: glycosyltransferase family 2 protein [Bacteroidota bacterium]|nr:glycosyltransferase family 2 protein [Flavisolibacter sp.]MBD0364701.1 glycosyltransferase family 2 protein [Flavisolibacter sp.]MBD0378127.1 glycosyltransferase family 2 protein [Flavisolibacter sp.]MDQ3846019.1 glycosyltransferase family 2 protein [Bacteroidota bacterium]